MQKQMTQTKHTYKMTRKRTNDNGPGRMRQDTEYMTGNKELAELRHRTRTTQDTERQE